MRENIKIGRWIITDNGIETIRENDHNEKYNISDIWEYEVKPEGFIYSLPLYICSKGWVSNVDLLDFNSAYLVAQERFENLRPENFPKISWSQTLRRLYKRINTSFDINSFEGRNQLDYQKEYLDTLNFEDQIKLMRIDPDEDLTNTNEIFGDNNSRKN